MDHSNDVLEMIKDVREYLLSLKETGVDEVGRATVIKKEHENAVCHPEFISGSQTMSGQEIPKQVRDDRNSDRNSDRVGDRVSDRVSDKVSDKENDNKD